MNPLQPSGLFITGTDTGVGKTYVATIIVRRLRAAGCRVGVYKPAESGAVSGSAGDAEQLWEAAGRPRSLDDVCPQRFQAPLAPHLAARAEGREIDADLLRHGIEPWLSDSDVVVVEGSGGLMSPVSDSEYVADLAYDFGFPLVVVARNGLGTINQTLQTLITAAAFREGLTVAGVVLNHPQAPDVGDLSLASNRQEIAQRCGPPVWGEVAWQADDLDSAVDWYQQARCHH